MQDWKFLGRYAVTTYPGNAISEYVVVGRNVVGYTEQNENGSWTYYEFAAQAKGQTVAADPIAKATAATAIDSVNEGRR